MTALGSEHSSFHGDSKEDSVELATGEVSEGDPAQPQSPACHRNRVGSITSDRLSSRSHVSSVQPYRTATASVSERATSVTSIEDTTVIESPRFAVRIRALRSPQHFEGNSMPPTDT